jgi:hypothetical protein
MNEVFATWESILPLMLFERMAVAMIGAGMFVHFICMAAAAPVKSPLAVLYFLVAIIFSAVGMFVTSVSGETDTMRVLLISGLGSMLLFWLWLWKKGLHVKDFLDKKYGT